MRAVKLITIKMGLIWELNVKSGNISFLHIVEDHEIMRHDVKSYLQFQEKIVRSLNKVYLKTDDDHMNVAPCSASELILLQNQAIY